MVKIETAVKISQEFPAGRASDYIWMDGQPWPIPEDEESIVISLEVFGDELDNTTLKSIGHSTDIKAEDGKVVCRTWFQEKARYVSEQMRAVYPPKQ